MIQWAIATLKTAVGGILKALTTPSERQNEAKSKYWGKKVIALGLVFWAQII